MSHPVKSVGFIGAGNMATALFEGMLKKGVAIASKVIASDPSAACLEKHSKSLGIRTTQRNTEVATFADVIFVAVKPNVVPAVLRDISPAIDVKRHLVVSVCAGVTCTTFANDLPDGARIVRVMPNTPALVGAGAAAFALGAHASASDADLVKELLSATGVAVQVSEKELDAVTGLSGSGPAYVFQFIEALSDGGVRAGLPRPTAHALAVQTVLGSALMVQQTGLHPGVLKDQVTSPGGTTITGVHALEDGGMRGTVISAVLAATKRAEELGKPAAKL